MITRALILFSSIFTALCFLIVAEQSNAYTIDWSGLYRVEGVQVNNSALNKDKKEKSYINHHFILRPKMIVADGLQLNARLDIFNSAANSQVGQFFGNGIGGINSDSNTLSDRQADETVRATSLYLTYDTEFMSYTVGRAPIEFGLGLTYNAGNGTFDHWYDNRDMISGRYVMGNLSLTTMFNKLSEGTLDLGDDVRELIFQIDYENIDSDTAFGVLWNIRKAGAAGNDFPTTTTAGASVASGFEGEFINFYLKRGFDDFNFAFEGGFAKGRSGVNDASSAEIELGGFGLALELDYQAPQSKWEWNLKAGLATGDDPSTTNKFEGFFFDRNYDVGILLFNHVFGQFDTLSSSLSRNAAESAVGGTTTDVETVSNALYISPGFVYHWKPTWDINTRLVYATLNEKNVTINSATTAVESDLGFEVDVSLDYKPHDRFIWTNQIGLLFPGTAFKGGTNNFDNNLAYGIMTKAAVRF